MVGEGFSLLALMRRDDVGPVKGLDLNLKPIEMGQTFFCYNKKGGQNHLIMPLYESFRSSVSF